MLTSDNGSVPTWYQGANQHRSAVSGARAGARRVSDWGETLLSADFRREGVVSNRLGLAEFGRGDSSIYTLGDRRMNLDVGIGHGPKSAASPPGPCRVEREFRCGRPPFHPRSPLSLRIDETGRAVAACPALRSRAVLHDLYYTVGRWGSQDLCRRKPNTLVGYR